MSYDGQELGEMDVVIHAQSSKAPAKSIFEAPQHCNYLDADGMQHVVKKKVEKVSKQEEEKEEKKAMLLHSFLPSAFFFRRFN